MFEKCSLKVKYIYQQDFSGGFKTIDTRINGLNRNKVIKACFKFGIPFKVGFRATDMVCNMNYIEAYVGGVFATDERRELDEKFAKYLKISYNKYR